MKPKKRQKLCYNCEGEIDLDVIVCPFCAADLREEKPELQRPSYHSSFSVRNLDPSQTQQSLYPSSPLAPQEEAPSEEEPAAPAPSEPLAALLQEEDAEEKQRHFFAPTILFTLGVQLFLIGMLMLLCSHKGVIILKWDARSWFFYVLASLPLLIFGYRSLSRL